jgi:hypothetical protein
MFGAVMVDIQKLKPGWHDYRTDIPQWISSGIGKVAAEWAVLERELEELIRLLMDIDIQHGRIIVNWMNAKTRSVTAQHLIQAHILQDRLTSQHLETFMKVAEKIEPLQTKRDILAHGVWDKHEGQWCTLKMRQSRKTPKLEPDLKKLGRAVLPQRDIVDRNRFRADAQEIVYVTKAIVSFCTTLQSALAPLRHTPPKYSRRRRDYHPKPTKQARVARQKS